MTPFSHRQEPALFHLLLDHLALQHYKLHCRGITSTVFNIILSGGISIIMP